MPIVTTNFIAGRMNKSVDERLLPPGEYIDALNVRLGATETTEIGAVENSKGNDKLTTVEFLNTALSATAVCIGAYEDGTRENIYWFIHDKNFTTQPGSAAYTGVVDLIVSYNTTNQVLQYHVISTSVLNFNASYLITGVDLVDGDLLFFTDDFNPPRVINVGRNYPDPVANVDQIVEEDLSVIVKPPGFEDVVGQNVPLTVPKVQLVTLPGNENYLKERFVCFAYRYRYLDNGYSATSLFSKPAFATSTFAFDTRNYLNSGMVNRYNGAVITFSTGSSRVSEIDLLYKDTTSNIIYVIERFKKEDYGWADNTSKSYSFTNSKIYTTIGADELLRQYDNVPRFAKAQTIMSNRLFYGNFIDGYDFKYGSAEGSTIALNYSTQYVSSNLDFISLNSPLPGSGVAYTISGTTENISNSKITFNLSEISAKLKANSVVAFSFDFEHAKLTGTTTTNCYIANTTFKNANFNLSVTITLDQDYSSVYDFCTSAQFQNAIGVGTLADGRFKILSASDTGNSLTDLFNNELTKPAETCTFDKFNSSITDAIAQQGFAVTGVAPGSDTFELQVIAMNYRAVDPADASIVTNMFEFFRFIGGETTFSSDKDTSSLHSNRDYETGIVYMDEYARASTVLVSEYNTVYIEPLNSVSINKIKVQINSLAPYWAKKYKFVLKPSLGTYETIFSNFYYVRPSDNVIFLKLEGDNANKVTKGQTLIVKADVDGALSRVEQVTVLDVTAESTDFLKIAGEVGFEEISQLPGLYMNVKNQNFNVTITDDAVIEFGSQKASSSTLGCNNVFRQVGYPCFTTQFDANGAVTGTTNYTVPGGSIIKLKFRAFRKQTGFPGAAKTYEWEWDQQYVASRDYTDLKKWYDGDNVNVTIAQPGNLAGFEADTVVATYDSGYVNATVPDADNPFGFAGNLPCTRFRVKLGFVQDTPGNATSPLYLGINSGIPGAKREFTSNRKSDIEAEIIVFRADTLMVFESEPLDANPDLYYDASEIFNIEGGFHMSGTDTEGGDQKQTATQDAIVNLNFADVYCFGNGVESYKIKDQLAAKSFQLGERTLAVSNQDYKETDRFEGLTYSGVYSSNSGTNNLNEFNLGLVNFKDLETSYGPIQKLYARKTDILTLQEDKISYVQAGKNILTDAVGGGAVTSVPQVLGQQVARIEEYGISFNPESFAVWGSEIFFTDAKRGTVLNLRGSDRTNDQLQLVSRFGMNSFFRDRFTETLTSQKLGAYDPYMNEYVLTINNESVPRPKQKLPCNTTISQLGISTTLLYDVDLGTGTGVINIPYIITSGSIIINVVWNNTTFTSGTLTTASTTPFSFLKNTATPNIAAVEITVVNAPATYEITLECAPEIPLTLIQVVVNSANYATETIHTNYRWTDGSYISNFTGFSPAVLVVPQASEYSVSTGIRGQGNYPSTVSDITLRTQRILPDNFNFDPLIHKLKLLSSNTLYNNSPGDIANLLATATVVNGGTYTNPSPGVFQGTELAFNQPLGNQYLYLVWEFVLENNLFVCYCPNSAVEACCECIVPCEQAYFGPVTQNVSQVCTTDSNTPGNLGLLGFNGTGSTPQLGNVVFGGDGCDAGSYLATGFYIVTAGPGPTIGPKNWVQIGVNGEVINTGVCP